MSAEKRILILYYFTTRDSRTGQRRGKCTCGSPARFILGGAKRKRYLCRKHTREWAKLHGYTGVDAV